MQSSTTNATYGGRAPAELRLRQGIERAIAENYDGHRLSGECAKAVLGEYGIDRVNWVLANTIHEKSHDGRFSRGNKEWAARFTIPQDTTPAAICGRQSPGAGKLVH